MGKENRFSGGQEELEHAGRRGGVRKETTPTKAQTATPSSAAALAICTQDKEVATQIREAGPRSDRHGTPPGYCWYELCDVQRLCPGMAALLPLVPRLRGSRLGVPRLVLLRIVVALVLR